MNGQLAIMGILKSDPNYTGFVGSGTNAKIFYDEAMETTPLPFSIIKTNNVKPIDTKDGPATVDDDYVYLTHFAATKKQVIQMSICARVALDRVTGRLGNIQVLGNQYLDEISDTERLLDKKVFTQEQLYKVMTTNPIYIENEDGSFISDEETDLYLIQE
jgi:hypothetical protein